MIKIHDIFSDDPGFNSNKFGPKIGPKSVIVSMPIEEWEAIKDLCCSINKFSPAYDDINEVEFFRATHTVRKISESSDQLSSLLARLRIQTELALSPTSTPVSDK